MMERYYGKEKGREKEGSEVQGGGNAHTQNSRSQSLYSSPLRSWRVSRSVIIRWSL